MQLLLVIIVFFIAIAFIGRKLFINFFSKEHNCEGCAVSQMHQKKS